MKHTIFRSFLVAQLALLSTGISAQQDIAFEAFELPLPPAPAQPVHMGFVGAAEPMFFDAGFPGEPLPTDPARMVMLAERLELTLEQRQSFGKVLDQATPRIRELMFSLHDARRQLSELRDGGEKTDKELRALADSQGRLHADLLYQQLATRQQLRKLLTAEQREKLESGALHWAPLAMHRAMREHRKRDN